MKENCWISIDNNCLEEVPPDTEGFVYRIDDFETGMFYIGKKVFNFRRKTRLSKKARVGTRKRVEIKVSDSNWQNYYGSNKELLALIKERGHTKGIRRTILKFCKTKAGMAYWETVYLILNDVLFRDDCFNKNILGRFYKNKIEK